MRNPQILGVRVPRGTYYLWPAAGAATSGTARDGGYHLSLDCLGRMLPFVLDFQGSAVIFVVRASSPGMQSLGSFTFLAVRC